MRMASWHRGRFDPVARGPDPLTVQLFSSLLPAANATPLRPRTTYSMVVRWLTREHGHIVQELPAFVALVRSSAQNKDFNKPIGEVLLNQKYFNGTTTPPPLFSPPLLIVLASCVRVRWYVWCMLCAGIGNYLRAEVLARAGVSPHLTATQLFTDPQYQYEDPSSSSSNAVITRR
jgi:hypothetical protein